MAANRPLKTFIGQLHVLTLSCTEVKPTYNKGNANMTDSHNAMSI